jgi:hypothetical protein
MTHMNPSSVPGVLLIYHHPVGANAPTIHEHVRSFGKYSRFPVWTVNTELGFPQALAHLRFDAIVLHYSLFGSAPFALDGGFWQYLRDARDSIRVAFFQDEHQNCQARFRLIDDLSLDCIFSLFEPSEYAKVYLAHTGCRRIRHTLTGYVDDSLPEMARRIERPYDGRTVDIGYRARDLAFHAGRGGQEKSAIGNEVLKRLAGRGLALDIATDARSRIYGEHWYHFVANCRAVLGVEAGVSIVDLDGEVQRRCHELELAEPGLTFEEVSRRLLAPYEDNVYYRTISPRIFEAAALRTCMILFEGRYNDLLQPMVHYIPLRKDFSNLDWAIDVLRDPAQRERITTRAFDDLIASGRYDYRHFIAGVDAELEALGLSRERANAFDANARAEITRSLGDAERRAEMAILRRRRVAGAVRRWLPRWAPLHRFIATAKARLESRRWQRTRETR